MDTINYSVIYRMGGPADCQWHQCRPVATMQEAVSLKDSIERGGRKAIIQRTSDLVSMGLPVGWCSKCDPMTGKCAGDPVECGTDSGDGRGESTPLTPAPDSC